MASSAARALAEFLVPASSSGAGVCREGGVAGVCEESVGVWVEENSGEEQGDEVRRMWGKKFLSRVGWCGARFCRAGNFTRTVWPPSLLTE